MARRLMAGAAVLALGACAAPAGVSQTQESLEQARVPSVSRSVLDLADQLAGEGKYAAALPLYRRAQQLDGDSEAAAMGLGNALLKTGRSAEALKVFEDAADDFSRSAAPMEGVGRAWMAMNHPTTALEAFNSALARDPGSLTALNGKGVALASLGRTDEALSVFEQGLRRAPDDIALKNNYGLALTLDNQADLGLPVLEEVVQDDDARAANRQSLAMAYGVAGQTEDARQMAAIDLDLIDVDRQIASYRTLAALPVEQRAAAAMSALGEEKLDLDKPANRVFLEPVEAQATVRRLLAKPAVAVVPEPAPEPEPAPVEETMDIPPLDDNIGYAVQIAAYRHAYELNPGWEMLKEKYKDLIGNLEPRRSEVDFGDRDSDPRGFFYRLNAGPLKTYSAAKTICDAISAEGGDCWVRPPLPAEGRVPTADTPQEDGALVPQTAAAETAEAAPESDAPAMKADSGEVWVSIDQPTPEEAAAPATAEGPDGTAPSADMMADTPDEPPYEPKEVSVSAADRAE